MDDRQQHLLDSIERAFHGVELGDGVSLHEATVVDDYGTPAQRLAARKSDEKRDWRKLIDDPELLRSCRLGALSFFDAAGLKFHLPACLSQAVKEPMGRDVGEMLDSLIFCLTRLNAFQWHRLASLESAQRLCVKDALVYLRDVLGSDRAFDRAIAGIGAKAPVDRGPAA
jgi:hypothetical protein